MVSIDDFLEATYVLFCVFTFYFRTVVSGLIYFMMAVVTIIFIWSPILMSDFKVEKRKGKKMINQMLYKKSVLLERVEGGRESTEK